MDFDSLIRSPVGEWILSPWFDPLATHTIADWYCPLSRAWAAAIEADGAPELFAAQSGAPAHSQFLLHGALGATARRWHRYEHANASFDDAFFGAAHAHETVLRAAHEARETAAHELTATRALFVPAHLLGHFPPVKFDIAGAAEVERRHGARLADPASAFAPPGNLDPQDAIQESSAVALDGARTSWLRFDCPVEEVPGTAWARVAAPVRSAGGPMPALIFAHGIAVESEFWRGLATPPPALMERGVAMIRPEGPYHGRRRTPGRYGGEDLLARGILGLLDYFHAHAIELGLLIAWARVRFGGPVALGGVSLGALAAQRAAFAARDWPPSMRPDALFLVTPSASVTAAALTGRLPRAVGVPEKVFAAGWDEASLARYTPLLEGAGSPPVDPGKIVVVLGATDDITPHDEGERLARDWRVPAANVFLRPNGHFTTSLDLLRDETPYHRLADVLR